MFECLNEEAMHIKEEKLFVHNQHYVLRVAVKGLEVTASIWQAPQAANQWTQWALFIGRLIYIKAKTKTLNV